MRLTHFIAALFVVCVVFPACKNEIPQKTQIGILVDVTDERFKDQNFVTDNLPNYLKLMKLDKETGGFSGGEIKLSLINEVSDSKSKTIKIEPGKTGLMGENPLNRKDEVERFYNELNQSFNQLMQTANWGKDASKIYQKITRECLKMKRRDFDRRILIIYSDMLENSKLFTFYGANWKSTIEKMIAKPEETLQNLGERGPALPDLSEFEIYIIAPRTHETDEKINLSEQLWTALFEFQGAVVYFSSDLEI